ncbi:succinylglutamate desuccinylase/aspartoacylase family protein [Halospeciosus flavus]|uniref:Succinylglutamate desuccinylase/aspartoacylase family protein n=1 Tax=Halospeciosus flavus TaxID=3032283 RepID=A0ABD5Z4U8_9EURY|nr:succinylglutamate desuccinylase/aspartoacylase family protein [Halospeciosus flavus]
MSTHSFTYAGGTVEPGTVQHTTLAVSETFVGGDVEIPITVVNGEELGPVLFCSAAVHGDELNGVKVVHDLVDRYGPADLAGTLVCLHVVNVPAYLAQQRYLPLYDQDLNRSFPGKERSTPAHRIANAVYSGVLTHCDYGIDLHTSTRGRTTTFHVRGQVAQHDEVARLADAFGANLVLAGVGEEENSLRTASTARGTPVITVEMGEAHRFQERYIERALAGIESVMTDLGMYDGERVEREWGVVADASQKTWVRSDEGGLVELHVGVGDVVDGGDSICTVHDHFATEEHEVTAPFRGVVAGLLQNPIAQPGHPVCHLVSVDEETAETIRRTDESS